MIQRGGSPRNRWVMAVLPARTIAITVAGPRPHALTQITGFPIDGLHDQILQLAQTSSLSA